MLRRLGYRGVCTLLGLVAGWVPMLLHGPIPQKFDVLYIRGSVTVWGFYLARLMIGFFVGNTSWPAPWWLRGPLCGFLVMLPAGIIVSIPFWNQSLWVGPIAMAFPWLGDLSFIVGFVVAAAVYFVLCFPLSRLVPVVERRMRQTGAVHGRLSV